MSVTIVVIKLCFVLLICTEWNILNKQLYPRFYICGFPKEEGPEVWPTVLIKFCVKENAWLELEVMELVKEEEI